MSLFSPVIIYRVIYQLSQRILWGGTRASSAGSSGATAVIPNTQTSLFILFEYCSFLSID